MQLEKYNITSFDGGSTLAVSVQKTEKLRELENGSTDRIRIARGGGYSYAPLSFGKDVVTQDMGRFNRILQFIPEQKQIVVEPGITLGEVFQITAPKGLYLPVQPGYPAITVGGCVASNVHGKNPFKDGTFETQVAALSLYHPLQGSLNLSREENPGLFALTCGGFGLTGIITSVTLRLSTLPGHKSRMTYSKITSLSDGYEKLRQQCQHHDIAYTWHNGFTREKQFGHGFLICGSIVQGGPPSKQDVTAVKSLDPIKRGRGYPPLWNRPSAGLINAFYLPMVGRHSSRETDIFSSLFPLVGKELYFNLFGRRGFYEYQVLIPHQQAPAFFEALSTTLLQYKAPALFLALRMFKGTQDLLKFNGDGVTLAMDLPRTVSTTPLMETLNRLMLEYDGIPFLVKNSSLTQEVVEKAFPEYQRFREELRQFDPKRLFQSEHLTRLGL